MDFLLGVQQAFQSSVTAIFNHKQIRAAELLAKQINREESGENSPSDEVARFTETLEKNAVTEEKQNTVNSATVKSGDVASSGAAADFSIPPISATESVEENEESKKKKIADLNEEKQDLKDLNNDAHFVPDLSGK